MFLIGLFMSAVGLAMLVGCFLLPAAARPGLIGGAVGVAGAGLALMLLDWPSRRESPGTKAWSRPMPTCWTPGRPVVKQPASAWSS